MTSNDAIVIQNSAELSEFSNHDLKRGYLVVPADEKTDLTSLPGGAETMTQTTNWWVERCLHLKCLVNPAERVLCRPFARVPIDGTYFTSLDPAALTTPGFSGLTINSTAFVGIELLHVSRVVPLMGMIILFPRLDTNLVTKNRQVQRMMNYLRRKHPW